MNGCCVVCLFVRRSVKFPTLFNFKTSHNNEMRNNNTAQRTRSIVIPVLFVFEVKSFIFVNVALSSQLICLAHMPHTLTHPNMIHRWHGNIISRSFTFLHRQIHSTRTQASALFRSHFYFQNLFTICTVACRDMCNWMMHSFIHSVDFEYPQLMMDETTALRFNSDRLLSVSVYEQKRENDIRTSSSVNEYCWWFEQIYRISIKWFKHGMSGDLSMKIKLLALDDKLGFRWMMVEKIWKFENRPLTYQTFSYAVHDNGSRKKTSELGTLDSDQTTRKYE